MIERFSYSSLESFKKCPAQFKFRYIKKIIKSHEGIESFVGKRVHEALEFLYNEKLSGRLTVVDGVIEKYHQNWKDNWQTDPSISVLLYPRLAHLRGTEDRYCFDHLIRHGFDRLVKVTSVD